MIIRKKTGKGYIYNIYNYIEEYTQYDIESGEYINLGACFMGEKVEVDLDDFMTNVENAYALNCKQSTGGEYVFSFNNLVYTNKYKVWDIMIRDTDNDGKLEIGQKPNEIIYDWDNYVEKDYEY